MSSLAEIEAATEDLTPEQRQELFLFLVEKLRGQRVDLPTPRTFSSDQLTNWIAEDEADLSRFYGKK